jgi:4-amino-4-deoxy-L-arabinose transferase-like glycosyltransferase
MGFFAQALAMKVFGSGVLGLRIFSALAGTLALVTNYLLFRGFFGMRVAQTALILLATYDLHIHYSRVGIHHVVDTVLYGGALFCLLIAIREGREIWFVGAGLVAGLGWYFYFGARSPEIPGQCCAHYSRIPCRCYADTDLLLHPT